MKRLPQRVVSNLVTYKNLITQNSTQGLTLVETIVVVGIIGILITVIMQVYNPLEHMQQRNDSQRKEDLITVQKALELYYRDYRRYPQHEKDTYYIKVKPTDPGVEWGFNGFAPYIQALPRDPGNFKYVYISEGDQVYQLYAHFEYTGDDSPVCFPDSPSTPCNGAKNAGAGMACGGVCNFGISSPNISP